MVLGNKDPATPNWVGVYLLCIKIEEKAYLLFSARVVLWET